MLHAANAQALVNEYFENYNAKLDKWFEEETEKLDTTVKAAAKLGRTSAAHELRVADDSAAVAKIEMISTLLSKCGYEFTVSSKPINHGGLLREVTIFAISWSKKASNESLGH